jgi:hypothetical protein
VNVTFAPNETWEYKPGRFVARGEKLRISGGPVWVDSKQVEHCIGVRGLYTFCFHTADAKGHEYIVCSGDAGSSVAFPLAKRRTNTIGVTGWKWRPYQFSKPLVSTLTKRRRIR